MGMGSCCEVYKPNRKQQYLQRCFFRTKVNKQRTPRNTYSTIHNHLVSHNAAQRWSLSFKNSYADWAPCQTDRFDLSCSSSASCDWQPDTEWREVRLSLYPVIMSLPGICELLPRLLAARFYENPSTPFFCTVSSSYHHPRCHPLFSVYSYLFIYAFIYLFSWLFNFRAASHCRHKKKGTCTFIIFQFRASRLTLQDPLMPQWGDRYLHFD